MNNNSLTDNILSSNNLPSLTNDFDNSFSSSNNDNKGFFSFLSNFNFTTWIIIILLLAFLGFNIFIYLAKGTQDITNFFAPLLKKIFGTSLVLSSQVIDVSAEGAKSVVGSTSNIINTGLTQIQQATPNISQINNVPNTPIYDDTIKHENLQQSSLNKALNSAQSQTKQNNDYNEDYASSSIQGGGKSGWCYIGIDRGFRSCAEVGVNDTCMSGQIFPSNEICMNPNLRP